MSERATLIVDAEKRFFLVGHASPPFPFHVGNKQHIWGIRVEFEPIGNVVPQHGRCKGTKTLAILDPQIEGLLHGG
jgi:hypothetical protein